MSTWWHAGRIVLLVGSLLALSACTAPAAGAPSAAASEDVGAFDVAAARQYCTDQGGKLVDRQAIWNTNADPSAWLRLANHLTLCEFESTADGNTTRISVDLVTLASSEPTLAAIAYLSKVPPTVPKQPSANPAEYNCQEGLHGSSTFGNGLSGGGWVNEDEPVFKVMNLCVFPDDSAIDAFGILYYATGAVRGADLAPKLRYQPGNQLPAVFGR